MKCSLYKLQIFYFLYLNKTITYCKIIPIYKYNVFRTWGRKMNKNELLEKMKERNRLSKSENQLAVDTFINIIYEALQNGEKVSLKGFGQFVTKERKSRNIRIPSSEKEVRVPAKEIPAFEPGEEFKNKVERIIE